eukprot:TRINITY_DN14364_c0_g1_i1.p1 TRINITY_DN14364_c0_g1~~TRINITY_DN14364_c0_g1_i1.p1  ORF type:complete len:314 (+),score=70.97 TRINITY_DN14364_c0_g1_i1:19-960(+)
MESTQPLKLDGKALGDTILKELKEINDDLKANKSDWLNPTLCIVTAGPQDATKVYMRHKKLACEKLGFGYQEAVFDASITQAELTKEIRSLAADPKITGIIIQLPLPPQIEVWEIVQEVPAEKDVDGLSATNQGRIQLGLPCLIPCTPQGVMEMLYRYKLIQKGSHAVILGRSPLVGKPMSNLLLGREANYAVTVLHRSVPDLKVHTLGADLIISCVGKADLVTADMVKEGAIVIDVGINFVADPTRASGKRMCGDVNPDVYPKTKAYTPVPGGVGPMTVAMLMRNVLVAAQRQQGVPELDGEWRDYARKEPK